MSTDSKSKVRDLLKRNKAVSSLAFLLILYMVLASWGITQTAYIEVDATRHAMDGLFYHDLALSMISGDTEISPSAIYEYSAEYFLHFPALGLVWWPPFFALVEALFYLLIGVSAVSAQLSVLFFGIVYIIFWYKTVLLLFDKFKFKHRLAFLSSLLFVLSPFMLDYSMTVMREVPAAALCMLASFAFLKALSSPRSFNMNFDIRWFVLSSVVWALAVLTRPETIFLGIVFFVTLISTRRWRLILDYRVILSFLLFLLIISPWFIFVITSQPQRLGESAGNLGQYPLLSISNWTFYFKELPTQLNWAVLLTGIIGLLYSIRNYRKELVFSFIFSASVFIFFSIVSYKDERHFIYALPFLILFASFFLLSSKALQKTIFSRQRALSWLTWSVLIMALILIISIFSAVTAVKHNIFENQGNHDTAEYVLTNMDPRSTIFFLGNSNGNFVYNARLQSSRLQSKQPIILRGSIFLASFNIQSAWGSKEHLESEQDIYSFFDEFGIQYVVVETPIPFQDATKNDSSLAIFDVLAEMLESEHFTRVTDFDVEDNRNLVVYRYVDYVPIKKDSITIPLFALSRNITVDLTERGKHTT